MAFLSCSLALSLPSSPYVWPSIKFLTFYGWAWSFVCALLQTGEASHSVTGSATSDSQALVKSFEVMPWPGSGGSDCHLDLVALPE